MTPEERRQQYIHYFLCMQQAIDLAEDEDEREELEDEMCEGHC